jgi:cytochrome c oxidase subunit II
MFSGWLLGPSASTFGPSIDHLYYLVLIITGVIFVLTEAALVYFSFRYRRQASPKGYYSHGNTKAEIIWTAVPAAILIYLGLLSQNLWSALRQPRTFPEPAVKIQVMAEQWLWNFKYPGPDGQFDTDDDVTVQNNAHIPLGKPVHFELRAQDVIHGFFVPELRIHQDTVPGLVSTVWVEANKEGQFDIRCTQFCGTNHYQMKGTLTVEAPEQFDAFLHGAKAEEF